MYFEMSKEGEQKLTKLIEETVLNNVEIILKDNDFLNKLINESLKGTIKAQICEILQTKNYRNLLRDRLMKQLGIEEGDNVL